VRRKTLNFLFYFPFTLFLNRAVTTTKSSMKIRHSSDCDSPFVGKRCAFWHKPKDGATL